MTRGSNHPAVFWFDVAQGEVLDVLAQDLFAIARRSGESDHDLRTRASTLTWVETEIS